MRIVIAGGGTGGHLFPGLALAEELRARGGNEVLFVGTARGIEARVLPQRGWPLELIDVAGIKGRGWRGLLGGLLRLPRALWQSWRILRRFPAEVVVGVGGYASGPLVLMAVLLRRRTAILEQNSIPGVTNRVLGRLVRWVFITFDESRRWFSAKKIRSLGNPIRDELRRAAAAAPGGAGAPSSTTRVLVCGGSQGARAVNRLAADAIVSLAQGGAILHVLHQTGVADRASVEERYRTAGIDANVREFIEDMAGAYRDADVVVGRAGATTLAELTAFGRAAILIPFPYATDNHQRVNADALERVGAARVLDEKGLTAELLARELALLAGDPALRRRMAEASHALGRPQAAAAIADQLLGQQRT